MKQLNSKLVWGLCQRVYKVSELWSICISLGFLHREIAEQYRRYEGEVSVALQHFILATFDRSAEDFDKTLEQAFVDCQLAGVYWFSLTENGERDRKSFLEDCQEC